MKARPCCKYRRVPERLGPPAPAQRTVQIRSRQVMGAWRQGRRPGLRLSALAWCERVRCCSVQVTRLDWMVIDKVCPSSPLCVHTPFGVL